MEVASVFSAKARENLEAAEVLFDGGMFNASANRAYYAALHAAVAALARAGLELDRISHDVVQASFSLELIRKRKVYPAKFRPYLMNLQTVRNNADYKLAHVTKKVAGRQLSRAKEFVSFTTREGDDV